MRIPIAKCVLLLASLLISTALLANDASPLNLAIHSQWVRFEVAGGLIVARPNTYRHNFTMSHRRSQGGRSIFASIRLSQSEQEFVYEMSSPQQRLRIVSRGTYDFTLERTPVGDASLPTVKYRQSPPDTVTLSVDGQELIAGGLWQLWLIRPEPCRNHLLPLLERLQPGWGLDEKCQAVEAALLRKASLLGPPDTRGWQELVERLDSNRYQERSSAEHQLIAQGPIVLPFLQSRTTEELSTEQRYRIDRIQQELGTFNSDQPGTVSLSLLADKNVWLALANRDDQKTRLAASDYLAQLTGQDVELASTARIDDLAGQISQLGQSPSAD